MKNSSMRNARVTPQLSGTEREALLEMLTNVIEWLIRVDEYHTSYVVENCRNRLKETWLREDT